MRASVPFAAFIAGLLLFTVAYSSYIVPLSVVEPTVDFKLIVDPVGGSDEMLPGVLGSSIDWTDDANGLYDPISGLLSPVPVGELIGLKPHYLRFPAGRLSQNYNWSLGIGRINERSDNPTLGPHPELSTFGTDEFFKLVNHTGADAVMVVNSNPFSDKPGSASQAADWVSYCNDVWWQGKGKLRSANGYTIPYNIKYWEMGYEAFNPRYWRHKAPDDLPAGTLYAQRLKEYSVAMKMVDPSIKIGAWMVLHPDMELFSADRSWNINFLNEAAGNFTVGTKDVYYFDYVVMKVYLPRIDILLNPEDLYRYSYAHTFASMRADMNLIQGLLSSQAAQRPSGIPLAIASFEPHFGNEGWNTLAPAFAGSALITADLAMQAMEKTLGDGKRDLLYACYGELNTPTPSSLMVNPDYEEAYTETWLRSPSYYAMAMCAELQGGRPLEIAPPISKPDYAVGEEKGLTGVKNVPIVSAFATLNPDGVTVTMVIINRDMEARAKCKIRIDEWPGRMKLDLHEIAFDSLISNNLAVEGVSSISDARTITGPVVKVNAPPASVLLLTIKYQGVT
jgi:alpha-L-arabinofuranosidase